MPSFRRTVLAVAAALVATVQADYYIDPSSVALSTRKSWCASELSSCPLICEQTPPYKTTTNTCDPETLYYGCLCGNGQQPNISEYSLTMPYFVCQEWGNQCVKKCGQNNECSRNCREGHPCGAQSPTRVNSTGTSSSSASSTASATGQRFSGLAGGDSGSNNPGSMAPALEAGRPLGLAIVVGGVVAGFALML